jgi:hypothetical protein
MGFFNVARHNTRIIALVTAMCVSGSLGISPSQAQINPIHGLPPAPPPVEIPAECKKSPASIINEIDQGISEIPNCKTKRVLGRAACCAVATQLSESGCERILSTAMNCCRLRFPLWTPPSVIAYTCNQAMRQFGITDAAQYCLKARDDRLNEVGCVKTPPSKRPQSTTAEESF